MAVYPRALQVILESLTQQTEKLAEARSQNDTLKHMVIQQSENSQDLSQCEKTQRLMELLKVRLWLRGTARYGPAWGLREGVNGDVALILALERNSFHVSFLLFLEYFLEAYYVVN